jgi:CBS domain-containing protein
MPVRETMQVREIMTDDVRVLSPNDSILKAACKMRDEDIGSLPVVSGNTPIGYVTDRDLVVRGLAAGLDPGTSVRQIMSEELVCCSEDDLVDAAAEKMAKHQVRGEKGLRQNNRAENSHQPVRRRE